MYTGTRLLGVPALAAVTLLAVGCTEPVSPRHGARAPTLDILGGQINGTLGESGTMLIKGFNPTNPHRGDAIIATFFWLGSTNIIDSVTDVLTSSPYTPVGNTYHLVEYVTSGGVSMATYVATNAQNFPDAGTASDQILAVRANLSQSVTDGGLALSSWSGAYPTYAQALAAHSSASGAGVSVATADPGALPVAAGTLAYGVTMASGAVGLDRPLGFTSLGTGSDASIVDDPEYAVAASAGSLDPQWIWHFGSQGTWLATGLALNEAPTRLLFTVQPSTSLPCPATIPPVEVSAKDDKGNTVTTYSGPVTIAIGRNGGAVVPGTLAGTLTAPAVNGVARFSNLCIDQPSVPGNGYTLRATTTVVNNLTVESTAFGIGIM